MDEIVKRLNTAIEKEGISFAKLAKKTGLAEGTLKHYAYGRPSYKVH